MKSLWILLAATAAICLPACAQTPNANAPDTPQSAPATKPSFALPPVSYDRPTGPAPDPKKDWVCDAPPDGVFQQTVDNHDNLKGEARNYVDLIQSQLYRVWLSNLPSDARNAWARGRLVKVRFVVMRDGTFSPPEVTVPSGRNDYDAAAVRAIRDRGVLPPLPEGIKAPQAICLTFRFNMGLPDTPAGWYKSANP
jgi:TonB family protein